MVKIELNTENKKPFRISELKIEVPGLPASLDGFLLVQLADLHAGVYTSNELIENALHLVNSLKPNVILHTGDFVHSGRHDIREILFKAFGPNFTKYRQYRRLSRLFAKELSGMLGSLEPTHGSYAVWGNHDYIEGVRTIKRYLPSGIDILVNDSIVVPDTDNKIVISGLDDYGFGKPSIEEMMNALRESEEGGTFNLLLNHNPDGLFSKGREQLSKFDMVLCGHTHGGQVCLPGSIAITTQTKLRRYHRGLDVLECGTHVYTSSGIGCSGVPFRLFCDPEIVLVRLEAMPKK